jgi:hypothetical protein
VETLSSEGYWSVLQASCPNARPALERSPVLQELQEAIGQTHCGHALVIDGARCDDVQTRLLHLSLAGIPTGPEKEKLLAIPRGLTIAHDHVDLLIKAGHDAVTDSDELQVFLSRRVPCRRLCGLTSHGYPRSASVLVPSTRAIG